MSNINNSLIDTNTNDIVNTQDTEISSYFTSQDIIELNEYLTGSGNHSIVGLIQHFDSKLGCNRVADMLSKVVDNGIKVMPKILFHPVTEKCTLTNGEFYITNKPYAMGDSIFVNNLIVVKLTDGSYVFHDDAIFSFNDLKCKLSDDEINGTVTVSYFVLDVDTIGNS